MLNRSIVEGGKRTFLPRGMPRNTILPVDIWAIRSTTDRRIEEEEEEEEREREREREREKKKDRQKKSLLFFLLLLYYGPPFLGRFFLSLLVFFLHLHFEKIKHCV